MASPCNREDDLFNIPTSITTDKIDSFINSIPITTESVYYAAEYLRLQSEIDIWKEKATKYELENENLKRELEKQTQLVDKLTKEKTEQCSGFQLGLDQLKRDNVKLATTLKKFEAANKLYIEKYRTLKSEHEKAKRVCSLANTLREKTTKLQNQNTTYFQTLQYMANFLDKCNIQLDLCAKKLRGEIVEQPTNIPHFTRKNLNQVKICLENSIGTISVLIGLGPNSNEINWLGSLNFVNQPSYQQCNNIQCNFCMPRNNLRHPTGTDHEPHASAPIESISLNNPSFSTSHLTPMETGSSSSYHPTTSPITPDEAEIDLLPASWTSVQGFQNTF